MTETNNDELSASIYAARRKEFIELIKQLRAFGAQEDLDLPRITVIGNQSAGKSSVIEAISGITVPRDAGTCTRCPMECRLSSNSGSWSCQVSIRWEFDATGKRKDEVSEELFGPRITSKADVEMRLRQAQATVLNPQNSANLYLAMTEDSIGAGASGSGTLSFSKNVVCVDLEGPDLTDLSFIDLPGLIQNAEDEVVTLVQDLVVSHIRGNCIILVAMPMTDDIENQKAMQLAKKEDQNGHRTIGIITKPDMLPAGSIKALGLWLDVLEGRRYPLRHGYYCTRQPDDAERAEGISPSEARRREADFFATTKPWAKSTCQDRFGTPNLVNMLSKLLVRKINDSLPGIQSQTSSLLSSCTKELSTIPPPLAGEPSTQLSILITDFSNHIRTLTQGGSGAGKLIHENLEAWEAFRVAIKRTAPNFVALVRDGRPENRTRDREVEVLSSNRQPFYLTDMRQHLKNSITRELPNNIPFESKVSLIESFQETWQTSTRTCFNRVREATVRALNEVISQKFGRYASLQTLLRNFTMELVQQHSSRCLEVLEAVLESEKMPFTQNAHYLSSSTEKWVSTYKAEKAGNGNEDQFSSEGRHIMPSPFLQLDLFGGLDRSERSSGPDPHSSSTTPSLFGSPQPEPVRPTPTSPDSNKIREILASLAEIGYHGLVADDLRKLNHTDEYEMEIQVMGEIRGYFQVSYKRVIDNVPSFIDLLFVRAVAKELLPFLMEKFELGSPNATARCRKCLAEDPEVVARRDELTARKKRLEGVTRELYNFGL